MPRPNIELMQSIAVAHLKSALSNKPNLQAVESYVTKTCQAIGTAWNMWRRLAKFRDLIINSVTAIGNRGCLQGPELESSIKSTAPHSTEWEINLTNAIASTFSKSWKLYQDSVIVPGLAWYPSFAAVPGPQAPPTPNVPMPLIICVGKVSLLSEESLTNEIVLKAGPTTAFAKEVASAIAKGFVPTFFSWLAIQKIINVLGQGPVPSYAPPAVRAGPVVGGSILSIPGHLAK